jgi:transcriptional regulator with XRE-family HTH domain
MADEVNGDLLARLVRTQLTEAPNLRQAAKAAGVSPATLSRVQRGHVPDIDSLVALARWLNTPIEKLLNAPPVREAPESETTVKKVEVYLRADPRLSPDSATRVADIFKAVYEEFAGE